MSTVRRIRSPALSTIVAMCARHDAASGKPRRRYHGLHRRPWPVRGPCRASGTRGLDLFMALHANTGSGPDPGVKLFAFVTSSQIGRGRMPVGRAGTCWPETCSVFPDQLDRRNIMLIRKAFCTFAIAAAAAIVQRCDGRDHAAHRHDGVGYPDCDRGCRTRFRGHAFPRLIRSSRDWCCGISPKPIGWHRCVRALRRRGNRIRQTSKTWIFHLRQGVKFHDGTDFNADAVIWNLGSLLQQWEPAIRSAEFGDVAGTRSPDGQLQEDRRQYGGHHHDEAGFLFPIHGGLIFCSLRPRHSKRPDMTGARSRPCRQPAPGRFASPGSCRGRRPIWRAGTAIGTPARWRRSTTSS